MDDKPSNMIERFVFEALKEIKDEIQEIKKSQLRLHIDVAGLKEKAGMWGLVAGMIPVLFGLGIWFIKTRG